MMKRFRIKQKLENITEDKNNAIQVKQIIMLLAAKEKKNNIELLKQSTVA